MHHIGFLHGANWLGASAAAIAVASPALAQQDSAEDYAMPAQRLSLSVRAVAAQSGRNVVASAELLDGLRAPPLSGRYTAREALDLLLRDSGLQVVEIGNVLTIQARAPRASQDRRDPGMPIVVTGTRIRGSAPVGAPLTSIDREAIDRSGYATTQQILQAIPQNFGGGANETTANISLRNNAGLNTAFGSSLNLRGLGTNSTLVLLNGNRPALGGISGAFADLSLIPSSAIDRIEVLTDGASAIYGSDAVAGVANVIFRDRFDGAETRLRYGTADGDFDEVQASQLFGTGWSKGGIVIAYEFYRRGSLAAADRDFATEDLRPFGGPDRRSLFANPATIIAADGSIYGVPPGQDGAALEASGLLPGVQYRSDAREGTDLLPRQTVHSAYTSFWQEVGDSLTLYGEGLFAERRFQGRVIPSDRPLTVTPVNPFYVDPIGTGEPIQLLYSFRRDLGPPVSTGRVRGGTGVLGVRMDLEDWQVDFHGAYGEQREASLGENRVNRFRAAEALADPDPATALNLFGDGSFTNPGTLARIRGGTEFRNRYRVWNAALRADGPLFSLGPRDVRLAIGAEYRRETADFEFIDDINGPGPVSVSLPGLPGRRNVVAAYAELLVPLADGLPAAERLDLSLAGRIEHYSDVGTTANPRLGLDWVPVSGLRFHGSYGESFRAPNFTDLAGAALVRHLPLIVADPASPTGTAAVLGLFGFAEGIGPERASTWTAGVEIKPERLQGLRLAVNYFDIRYRDRIAATQDVPNYLTNRAIYGGLILDNPPAELVQQFYASPSFSNPLAIPASSITAILDGRIQNLSSVEVNGVDFDLGYRFQLAGGDVRLGASGSWLFGVRQQLTPQAPARDVVGTLANPAELRLRGRAGWSRGGLDVSMFVNFTDSYENRFVTPVEKVASWTTVDLRIGWQLPRSAGLGDLRLSLSMQNIFDRDPPYVDNRASLDPIGYDPEQASPVGRLVALQLVKTW